MCRAAALAAIAAVHVAAVHTADRDTSPAGSSSRRRLDDGSASRLDAAAARDPPRIEALFVHPMNGLSNRALAIVSAPRPRVNRRRGGGAVVVARPRRGGESQRRRGQDVDGPWTGRGPAAGCHVDIPWTGRGDAVAVTPRRRRGESGQPATLTFSVIVGKAGATNAADSPARHRGDATAPTRRVRTTGDADADKSRNVAATPRCQRRRGESSRRGRGGAAADAESPAHADRPGGANADAESPADADRDGDRK